MKSKFHRIMWASLSLIFVCTIVFTLIMCYCYLELRFRVLLAREQVQVFAAMCEKAWRGDVHQAIECLEYTIMYYPTGTKQAPSSPLNEVVETSRMLAVQDIIAFLRLKSNQDFGEDPYLWIRKLGKD